MAEDIYLKANKLKENLDNDPRVALLNKLEKEMNNNEEVMALAYKKDMACLNYSDALQHYSEESEEVKNALKELHEAKKNLDSHPVVKEYLKAYAEVRDLYNSINEILFSDFTPNLCPKENK